MRRGDPDALPGHLPRRSMIAIDASQMRQLSGRHRQHLAHLVGAGATLYVRGVARGCATIDFRPFAAVELAIAPERRAVGYRFTASRMLPAVLAGEEVVGGVHDVAGLERLDPPAEKLLMARHVDGVERVVIFALRYGAGCVVCDLHPEVEDGAEAPIVTRLARREVRQQDVGALIAADRAAARKPEQLPPFNLMVDDRPVNFDHFNSPAVLALLHHIDRLYPRSHTDFAWTPSHSSPCRSYLDAMKEFRTGFVWHGLWRHVDHRAIADPAAELAQGWRLVGRIQRRFGIRLQPIMVFPFERSAPGQFPLLAQAGFVASVEQPRHPPRCDIPMPGYLAHAQPAHLDPGCGFSVLHRYPAASLTHDRMLAMAAIGLPIVAFAHPEDVGLRRFSRFWDRGGDPSHFDQVLKFAAAKGLPSRSTEDIAAEVREIQPADDHWTNMRPSTGESCSMTARQR